MKHYVNELSLQAKSDIQEMYLKMYFFKVQDYFFFLFFLQYHIKQWKTQLFSPILCMSQDFSLSF